MVERLEKTKKRRRKEIFPPVEMARGGANPRTATKCPNLNAQEGERREKGWIITKFQGKARGARQRSDRPKRYPCMLINAKKGCRGPYERKESRDSHQLRVQKKMRLAHINRLGKKSSERARYHQSLGLGGGGGGGASTTREREKVFL